MSAFKIDLHTHSYGSPDGSLRLASYHYFLHNHLLDYIAITDHNDISTAEHIRDELGPLGKYIIVGEEIQTKVGEIVGLYLTDKVPAGLTLEEAVRQIKAQGGLVYVPHPFETVRSGISQSALDAIATEVDIVEAWNGRAVFQNRGKLASAWAIANKKAMAASSDAHGRFGWGYTHSVVTEAPTKENLVGLLSNAGYENRTVGLGVIYPKLNRAKNKLRGR